MAVWILGGRGTGAFNASTTYYFALGNGLTGNQTTELTGRPCRTATRLSGLYIHVGANDRGASTYKLRVAGADVNQTITIGASATGDFQDTTHSDVLAGAGELVNSALVVGAGGSTFTAQSHGVLSSSVVQWCNAAQGINGGTNTTDFLTLQGNNGSRSAAEVDAQIVFRTAGVLKNLAVSVSANASGTATTFKSRINGGDGTLLVSFGAGATGLIEDTTHSDTIASGNSVCLTRITTSAGSITIQMMTTEFLPTGTAYHTAAAGNGGSTAFTAGSTSYVPPGAILTGLTIGNAEALVQTLAKLSQTVRNLYAYVSVNGTTGGTNTIALRKGGATSALVVNPGTGATGAIEDTTHSVALAPTDTHNYIVTAGTGGSLTLTLISILVRPGRGVLVGEGGGLAGSARGLAA